MIENNNSDEISIRDIIKTLLEGWLIILILVLTGSGIGFGVSKLQKPIFQSTATISIDSSKYKLPFTTVDLLSNDMCKQLVAEKLETSINNLQNTEHYNIFQNGTIITITIKDDDPVNAMNIANAWAEAGIETSLLLLQNYYSEELKAREVLMQAEKTLTNYLVDNHLNDWNWNELSALIGTGQTSPSTISSPGSATTSPSATSSMDILPPISIAQRLKISELMRDQFNAYEYYEITRKSLDLVRFNLALAPPTILARATLPEKPFFPNVFKATMVGFSSGLLIAILWIFLVKWWHDS